MTSAGALNKKSILARKACSTSCHSMSSVPISVRHFADRGVAGLEQLVCPDDLSRGAKQKVDPGPEGMQHVLPFDELRADIGAPFRRSRRSRSRAARVPG